MKQLRRMTKCDILLNIFEEIGDRMSVKEVCETTGIKNYNSLKGVFSYIRKAPHIPDENRVDVRIQDGICIRIK